VPIAVAAGIGIVIALIVYLIVQANAGPSANAADEAERDDSTSIPGRFAETQGRGHFAEPFSLARTPTPFCDGVVWSGGGEAAGSETPDASDATPASTATAVATPTTAATSAAEGTPEGSEAGEGSAEATRTPPADNCYATNPPSSGRHLNVQRGIDVGGGAVVNIPPDPDVYPPDVKIPREAIPHLLEHAGVYVSYHCAEGDTACQDVVDQMTDLVNDRIDNHDDRVVLANDDDLPVGIIGLSSWTRWDQFPYGEYDEEYVERFIDVNACRFDPEGYCG
jgi:hypothetical protein